MTIAGVYLSPEGVVLGADSTASVGNGHGMHFYDFNQKVFEVGESSSMGLLTWGLAGFQQVSFRTLIATFADSLTAAPPTSVVEATARWTDHFWAVYDTSPELAQFRHLDAMAAPGTPPTAAGVRDPAQEQEWANLQSLLVVGFCIAGYALPARTPEAVVVIFRPEQRKPVPTAVQQHSMQWWGVPNFFNRLLRGADDHVIHAIKTSGKWTGTDAELQAIVDNSTVVPLGTLPIRDAVDYVHTCIHSTIKAIKFSGLPQVCGGPIELAVVTSDRKFRWVRHKPWDAAILDGALL